MGTYHKKTEIRFKQAHEIAAGGFVIRGIHKIIIVLLFLVFCGENASGQFRTGPLAGISRSRFIYEDDEYKNLYNSDFKSGYHLGVALNYRVSKVYSLHTELSYLKKGIDVRYADDFVNIRNRSGFAYLSVPVLLRISIHNNIGSQHVEFYGNVGPEVNYWLGGRGVLETSERSDFVINQELRYKVSFRQNQEFGSHMVVGDPSRIQMSVGAGGGAIVDLGRGKNLALDFRLSLGMGKSFHGKDRGGDYGLKLYNENLEGVHHTMSINTVYLQDINLRALQTRGKAKKR